MYSFILATGLEIEDLFLGDVINVIVDYGKPIDQEFKLEIVSCYLVSSTQTFALISDEVVNQESGQNGRISKRKYETHVLLSHFKDPFEPTDTFGTNAK